MRYFELVPGCSDVVGEENIRQDDFPMLGMPSRKGNSPAIAPPSADFTAKSSSLPSSRGQVLSIAKQLSVHAYNSVAG